MKLSDHENEWTKHTFAACKTVVRSPRWPETSKTKPCKYFCMLALLRLDGTWPLNSFTRQETHLCLQFLCWKCSITRSLATKRGLREVSCAAQAISQRTSCSQSCVPTATKAFLFELSENSSSCLFTQEQSEPPVAIVVKVFSSHRSPASSKEPQSPRSAIVPLCYTLVHTGHTAHTDSKSGPFLRPPHGPHSPSQVCAQLI